MQLSALKRHSRSQSSHRYEDPALLITQSAPQHMAETLQGDLFMKKLDLEDKRLAQLKDNARFLKKQLAPLNDNNRQLRHHVLALTYYIEQRRNDFASLLKPFDSNGISRELDKQLWDLEQIFAGLKDDMQHEEQQKKGFFQETKDLKVMLRQESLRYENTFEEMENSLRSKQQKIEDTRRQKDEEIQKLQKEIEYHKKLASEIKDRMENFEQIHQQELQQKQQDIDYHIKEAYHQQNLFQEEIARLKEHHHIVLQKEIQTQKQRIDDMKAECDDQINKNEAKHKKLTSDFNTLKSEQTTIQNQRNQLEKQVEKLQKKIENQINDNKKLRQDLSTAKAHIEQSVEQIQELMTKTSRLQKEKDEIFKKSLLTNESIKFAEEEKLKLERKIADHQLFLSQLKEEHQTSIDEIKQQLNDQEVYWRKKMHQQQQKFENLIKQIRKENDLEQAKLMQRRESILQPMENEDIFLQVDFQAQKDDDELTSLLEHLKQENKHFEVQLKELQAKEKITAQRISKEVEEKRLLIQKDAQRQISILQDRFNRELQEQTDSFQYKIQAEQEYCKNQLEKAAQDKVQSEKALLQKINEQEQQLQTKEKKIQEYEDMYIEIRHRQYQSEEQRSKDHQIILDMHELQLKEAERRMSEVSQQHQLELEKLQSVIDQHIKQNEATEAKLVQARKENQVANNNKAELFKQINALKNTIDHLHHTVEEREKHLQLQNETIKYLQLEVENSKQTYNIFRGKELNQERPKVLDAEVELHQMGLRNMIMNQGQMSQGYNTKRAKKEILKDKVKERDDYSMNFNLKKTERMPVGRIRKTYNQSQPIINRSLEPVYQIPNSQEEGARRRIISTQAITEEIQ